MDQAAVADGVPVHIYDASASAAPIDATLVAGAIAGVIRAAQCKGQTLEELQAEVLADDQLLGWEERQLLSEIVTEAWNCMTSDDCMSS